MTHRNYDHDIEQIRAALHHPTGSRASVMVGSGFSFNAQRRFVSASPFPSWPALTESLAERLYPNDMDARAGVLRNAGATSGALRIAQEFEAAFGRTVLLNHLRDLLPDREHEPGQLHFDLLRLPWADVFTTNYDTLLERAALPLRERRYEIARCVNDLPLKRRPRIVKLHGTLPELNDCILTEDDYRTYPDRFSPFVAEVQVAMVESHLCLVGFSGDDPNFLAWSGWVRDRLGTKTLPIYLWTLNQSATFQVRMLEQRCIIPLPLPIITGHNAPDVALRAFLQLLRKPTLTARPRWCLPRHLKDEGVERVEPEPKAPADPRKRPSAEEWLNTARVWRQNRKYYQGWTIPHVTAIEKLWEGTERWAAIANENPEELSGLHAPQCVFVLYELLWRFNYGMFPLFDGVATAAFAHALKRYSDWRRQVQAPAVQIGAESSNERISVGELDYAAMELRLELLRHARETGGFDRFEAFKVEIESTIDAASKEQRERVRNCVAYQTALACMSQWKDHELNRLLAEWDTSAAPLWALRRAGLLIEVGERRLGEECLIRALQDLRTTAGEGTPETWSIESWVIYILRWLREADKFLERFKTNVREAPLASGEPFEAQRIDRDRLGAAAYRAKADVAAPQAAEPLCTRGENSLLVLDWLRQRDCNPDELLAWVDEQLGEPYFGRPSGARIKKFEPREWQQQFHSPRHVASQTAAYRALRFIEDAGLPLQVGSVSLGAPIAERAIRILAESSASEAKVGVLRMRNARLLGEWFTRQRIAVLPQTEIERLHATAESCVRNFAGLPQQLARDSEPTRKLLAALELLSRVAIRADERKLQELFLFAAELPVTLRVWERTWLAEGISTLMKRLSDGLSTSALRGILSELMRQPVPGAPAFPALPEHVQLIDPVTLLDQRIAPEDAVRSREVGESVDAAVRQLTEASVDPGRATEREHLVLRLVTLAGQGLLDAPQRKSVTDALFMQRDKETGFPINTGCLDSAVLLFAPFDEAEEHKLFAAAYLTKPWPTEAAQLHTLLASLAKSGPAVEFRPHRFRRGVNWSVTELAAIADHCRNALEQCERWLQADATKGMSHPMLRAFPPTSRAEAVAEQAAAVIDDVLLHRKNIAGKVLETVVSAITRATRAGLPVLRACPKLAAFDSRFRKVLAEEIVGRLGENDERLRHALSSLNHWANQLADPRIPRIPDIVIAGAAGQLNAGYSYALIHVLDTVRNLLYRLPARNSRALLKRSAPAIEHWSRAFDYNSLNVLSDRRLRDELPDLRASMTRLCSVIQNRGLSLPAATSWLESVHDDPLPEVRRALSELDA